MASIAIGFRKTRIKNCTRYVSLGEPPTEGTAPPQERRCHRGYRVGEHFSTHRSELQDIGAPVRKKRRPRPLRLQIDGFQIIIPATSSWSENKHHSRDNRGMNREAKSPPTSATDATLDQIRSCRCSQTDQAEFPHVGGIVGDTWPKVGLGKAPPSTKAGWSGTKSCVNTSRALKGIDDYHQIQVNLLLSIATSAEWQTMNFRSCLKKGLANFLFQILLDIVSNDFRGPLQFPTKLVGSPETHQGVLWCGGPAWKHLQLPHVGIPSSWMRVPTTLSSTLQSSAWCVLERSQELHFTEGMPDINPYNKKNRWEMTT